MTTKIRSSMLPPWLLLSLLTVVLWGAWGLESKYAIDRVSAAMNQLFFPVGLIPIAVWAVKSPGYSKNAINRKAGAIYGLLTGFLGGLGNFAFYGSLSQGGKASIVTPIVGLAPLVTVILAMCFLDEKLNRSQIAGLVLALGSIYLLST